MSAVMKDVMVYNAPQLLGVGLDRHKCTCGSQSQSYEDAAVANDSISDEIPEGGPLGQPVWNFEEVRSKAAIANERRIKQEPQGFLVDNNADAPLEGPLGQPFWNWDEIANEGRS